MTDEQPDTVDPIENMPAQLREPNRRKRAAKNGFGNPPSQVVVGPDSLPTPPSYEELLERVERLEHTRVASQFVEAQPEGKPQFRVADDEELTEFQQSLRAGTRAAPTDYQREVVSYNYPQRLFAKPDGSIVSLQGDPGNRAYYRDKGFVELTPEQVRQWYGSERQKVYAIQQQKAHLITTLRRTVQLDPALKAALDPSWDGDLGLMTVQELQGQLDWVAGQPTADGRPRRLLERLPRLQDADSRRADAEAKRLMEGVETTPSRTARAQFEAMQEQLRTGGQGRTIEVEPGPRKFA